MEEDQGLQVVPSDLICLPSAVAGPVLSLKAQPSDSLRGQTSSVHGDVILLTLLQEQGPSPNFLGWLQ